jgi:hypothetical protein
MSLGGKTDVVGACSSTDIQYTGRDGRNKVHDPLLHVFEADALMLLKECIRLFGVTFCAADPSDMVDFFRRLLATDCGLLRCRQLARYGTLRDHCEPSCELVRSRTIGNTNGPPVTTEAAEDEMGSAGSVRSTCCCCGEACLLTAAALTVRPITIRLNPFDCHRRLRVRLPRRRRALATQSIFRQRTQAR